MSFTATSFLLLGIAHFNNIQKNADGFNQLGNMKSRHSIASVLYKLIGSEEQLYKSEIAILADQQVRSHSSINDTASGLEKPRS